MPGTIDDLKAHLTVMAGNQQKSQDAAQATAAQIAAKKAAASTPGAPGVKPAAG